MHHTDTCSGHDFDLWLDPTALLEATRKAMKWGLREFDAGARMGTLSVLPAASAHRRLWAVPKEIAGWSLELPIASGPRPRPIKFRDSRPIAAAVARDRSRTRIWIAALSEFTMVAAISKLAVWMTARWCGAPIVSFFSIPRNVVRDLPRAGALATHGWPRLAYRWCSHENPDNRNADEFSGFPLG